MMQSTREDLNERGVGILRRETVNSVSWAATYFQHVKAQRLQLVGKEYKKQDLAMA